jgi:hypothetical protein
MVCCARAIALMMETASTSETSANFYQTARRNNLEDSHLQTHEYFLLIFHVTAAKNSK